MIELDIRTSVFLYFASSAACAFVMVRMWQQNRHRFAGLGLLSLNFLLQAGGLALIGLRGMVPDWMSIVLANGLTFGGAWLNLVGLEHFVGKHRPQTANGLGLAFGIAAMAWFTYADNNVQLRTLIAAVLLLAFCSQAVWLLWHRVAPEMRSLTIATGAVSAGYCLLSIARIIGYFSLPQEGSDYFQSGNFQTLVIAAYLTLGILMAHSLALMVDKRLVSEVERQEEKFSRAFHASPIAISISHLADGCILEVNDTFCSLFGYERAEVIGKRSIELGVWQNPQDRLALVKAMHENRPLHGLELPLRKKSGEPITALFSSERMNLTGVPASETTILTCLEDITQRKQAATALRASEMRYRALVEWMPEALAVVRDERVLFANPAAVAMMGAASVHDLVGEHFLHRVHPESQQHVLARLQSLKLHDDTSSDPVVRLIKADGSVIEVETRSTAIEYDGAPAACVALRDVTAQHAADAQVRKLSLAVEQSPESIIITDAAARIEYVNDAFLRTSGYRREELIGNSPRLLQSGKTPPETYAAMWGMLSRGESWKGEFLNRRKDGSEYVEASTITPLRDENGSISHFVALNQDITESRRAAELQLRQSALLIQRNEELDRFNRAAVGRELDMIDLKLRINALSAQLGLEPPYKRDNSEGTPGNKQRPDPGKVDRVPSSDSGKPG